MSKDEINTGESGFRIGGVVEFDVRCIFLKIDFTGFCNDLLTLCIIVIGVINIFSMMRLLIYLT